MKMYVAREDAEIVASKAVREMKRQYEAKFGERFAAFCYADFHGTWEKCAGQVYKETLEKAVQDDKPYHIVSHRYDVIEHGQ